MISITDYTTLCKGNLTIITGPPESFCPICGGILKVRSTCIRKVRHETGTKHLRLRVMMCSRCHKTHREIPDEVIPYKRNSLSFFCEIAESEKENYPCDMSTWQRVKWWLSWFLEFARNVERGIACTGLLEATRETGDSLRCQTAYYVRLVINSGNWIHNRSAMHVA